MAKKHPQKDQSNRRKERYPYCTLRMCLKLGSIVKENGGERAGIPKSVIASGMNLNQASSNFAQIIASAKIFGIVDGTSEIRLTDLGREYFFPTTDNGAQIAAIDFLSQPSAFAYLIKRFDGSRPPTANIIGNLLGKDCGIPESWRNRAAQIFLGASLELGVLDANGSLRYEATKHTLGIRSDQATTTTSDKQSMINGGDSSNTQRTVNATTTTTPMPMQLGSCGNVWMYTEEGKTIRLETPDNLTASLWDRLNRYVDILKPAKGA